MQNKWGCISGYLEPHEDQLARALTEILEETGIRYDEVVLQKILGPVRVKLDEGTFVIQPFCFSSKVDRVNLNWEHIEYRWVGVADIELFDLVPKLEELINCCFEQ